jgi:hypothetical protein
VNGFADLQQDNPQVAIVHLWNTHPTADSTILLNLFLYWLVNGPLNPRILE